VDWTFEWPGTVALRDNGLCESGKLTIVHPCE